MNLTDQNLLNEKYMFLYNKAKSTNNDEAFSKQEETKKIAFEILEIVKRNNQKLTYKNLTNMNLHFLVKVLNYNDFFNKELNREFRADLKKLPLIR